jgi:hypothetical protein
VRAALIAFLLCAAAGAGEYKLLRFSPDGPWLHPVGGGYDWQGFYWLAHIDRDGFVEFSPMKVGRDLGFTSDDEKRWFLDETDDLRNDLAIARRDRELAHSFETLPNLLGRVWQNGIWSLVDKHEILFTIWDECAEPDDAELGHAGRQARKIIDGFIRKNLPEGSPGGFSRDELASLNLKRAKGPRFDPYHPSPDLDRP